MANRLTYEELLQELKDNRDKKIIEPDEFFHLIFYQDLGKAIYDGNFNIEWKGEEYYRNEMPEDIAKEIAKELFAE